MYAKPFWSLAVPVRMDDCFLQTNPLGIRTRLTPLTPSIMAKFIILAKMSLA